VEHEEQSPPAAAMTNQRAGALPSGATSGVADNPRFEYLCRLADDRLVLGHRLSEWCGHAPILEEDIALANFALDFVGQASSLLTLAGEIEGKGRSDDALAYLRDAVEYRNALLVEVPNGDFARTIMRQFLFDVFDQMLLEKLAQSSHGTLAGIAAKALKEARYHIRHSGTWVVRLGDGTEESHRRTQRALDELWPFTDDLFMSDAVDRAVSSDGFGTDVATFREAWRGQVTEVVSRATLVVPSVPPVPGGGRVGRHTEHLGRMLAEMQILPRSHPGAAW
jgi:ring-1,2-phenylacetyl-CoA epoxidase subunit PaaC